MEYMCKEQASQGKRLERLEQAPTEDFKHYKRAIVTALTGTLTGATIGTSAVLADVNWPIVASAAGLAGVLSLLTSIAGLPEVKENEEEL